MFSGNTIRASLALIAVLGLTGCVASAPASTDAASPTRTAFPTPTVTATATETPTPPPASESPAPADSYDLDAAYTTCVDLSASAVGSKSGTYQPLDAASVGPASENQVMKEKFAGDPNALALIIKWNSDSSDLEIAVFCSVSGSIDAPVVVVERASSNA